MSLVDIDHAVPCVTMAAVLLAMRCRYSLPRAPQTIAKVGGPLGKHVPYTATDLGKRLVQPLASDNMGERQADGGLLGQALKLGHLFTN